VHAPTDVPLVAGLGYRERLSGLPAAFEVTLVPEPEQPYNPNAIAVHATGGKIGYVAPEIARLCYDKVVQAGTMKCRARRLEGQAGRGSGIEALLDLSSLLAP
jgi:hypothetical protein